MRCQRVEVLLLRKELGSAGGISGIREAVILAAGLGVRLRRYHPSTPKFAIPIGNTPLICYPFRALQRAGVIKFTIVVSKNRLDKLKEVLNPHLDPETSVLVVENPYPERGNGYSFFLTEGHTSEKRFFISMCDHLYPPSLPSKLSAAAEADLVVGGDPSPSYIDLDEATKILANEMGRVLAIGKGLPKYNYVDVGVFVASQKMYQLFDRLADLKELGFSNVVECAVGVGYDVMICDVSGIPWTDVDTKKDIEELLEGGRREVLASIRREVGLNA